MFKFFVEKDKIIDKKVHISGTDLNHIKNVLRLKKDDKLQICNKDSLENYICKIDEYNKDEVICTIIEKVDKNIESNVKLDIYQGLPKADKMELIIQKTTEIGVQSIIPVKMERCIVKLDEKDALKKIDRWQKIAEVAAKQSKRDVIPKIENIKDIDYICNIIEDYDCFIVAYEEEKDNKIKDILKNICLDKEEIKIGVLIGPEGGIDIKEIDRLKKNTAKVVTLGSRILRTETAPIVMSSIILYELEN